MSKTKKNIKKFVSHHYIKSVFSSSLLQQKVKTFDVLILPMASKKIRTSKIENINYPWRITYGYQGLWEVRLGSIKLGQVRFHYIKLGQIKLGSGQKVFKDLFVNAKMPQVLTPQVVKIRKSYKTETFDVLFILFNVLIFVVVIFVNFDVLMSQQ